MNSNGTGYWWAFSSYKPTELLTCSRVAHRGWGGSTLDEGWGFVRLFIIRKA